VFEIAESVDLGVDERLDVTRRVREQTRGEQRIQPKEDRFNSTPSMKQAQTKRHVVENLVRSVFFLIGMSVSLTASARAQDADVVTQAILKLPREIIDKQQNLWGQIYCGIITATITDKNNDVTDFEDGDIINARITSNRASGSLIFAGTRPEFDDFIDRNARLLLKLFFPTSISEGVTGEDAAQNHSQQLLINIMLSSRALEQTASEGKVKRSQIGGLLEYEWFEADQINGKAVQGVVYTDRFDLALQGRYTVLDDHLGTKSLTAWLDFCPHLTFDFDSYEWQVGLESYSSFLNSTSNSIHIGSLEFGGGPWSSLRIDFPRVRIGVGAVLQGSKIHLPSFLVPKGTEFLVDAINDRDLEYNITYGTILGVLLADRLSLNAKIIGTRSSMGALDKDVTSQATILMSLSYLFGDVAPIDIGYKISTGLEQVSARGVFLQGNFRW
jgi:hypothetical protein